MENPRSLYSSQLLPTGMRGHNDDVTDAGRARSEIESILQQRGGALAPFFWCQHT
jgi:hypothetical protein